MLNFRLSFILLSIAITVLSGISAQELSNEENKMLQLENKRYLAMTSGDFDFLDATLSDELLFIHASGRIDPKKAFVKRLRSKVLQYKSIKLKDVKVRVYGNTCVITGVSLLDITVRDKKLSLSLIFTTVYVKREKWQVVAYQSTHKHKAKK